MSLPLVTPLSQRIRQYLGEKPYQHISLVYAARKLLTHPPATHSMRGALLESTLEAAGRISGADDCWVIGTTLVALPSQWVYSINDQCAQLKSSRPDSITLEVILADPRRVSAHAAMRMWRPLWNSLPRCNNSPVFYTSSTDSLWRVLQFLVLLPSTAIVQRQVAQRGLTINYVPSQAI